MEKPGNTLQRTISTYSPTKYRLSMIQATHYLAIPMRDCVLEAEDDRHHSASHREAETVPS